MNNKETLTIENAKPGLVVISKADPDWGTFRLTKKYSEGIWETNKGRVIFESEFHFWAIN